MKKMALVLLVAGALIVLSFFSYPWGKKFELKTPKIVRIGNVALNIELADTDVKRIEGLSGKTSLGDREAMLFVFDTEGYYGFWMKDMNFPIDIAWLDKNKKIIYIENSANPASYPKSFVPPSSSLYVLETKAGFFESNKIKIGDIAEF